MLQAGRVGLEVPPVPLLSWHFRSYESPKGARHGCVAGVLRVPVAWHWTLHRATWKSQTSPRKSSLSIHGLVRIREDKPRKRKRINRQMGGENGNKTKIKKKAGFIDSCVNLGAVSRAGGVSLKAAVASSWSGGVSGGRLSRWYPLCVQKGGGQHTSQLDFLPPASFFPFFF